MSEFERYKNVINLSQKETVWEKIVERVSIGKNCEIESERKSIWYPK